MSQVQVIGLPQSNYVWAVRIALAEKGVEHESIPAAPHTPEVLAVAFDEARTVGAAITPVPMTIACLLQNTLTAACRARGVE